MTARTKVEILQKLQKDYELPAMPAVASYLLSLLAKKDSLDLKETASVIETDAVLSAKFLKMSNMASLAGFTINTVQEAISRLGLKETSNIIVSFSAIRSFKENAFINFEQFWTHCLSVAYAAKTINKYAENLSEPLNLGYTAGLFHNTGVLALLDIAEDKYNEVLKQTHETGSELHIVEREVLGINHAEVGALLLEAWKFPSKLIQAVRFQYTPCSAPPESAALAKLVHIANFVCNNQGLHNGSGSFPIEFSIRAWDDLGLDVNKTSEIIKEVKEEIRSAEHILGALSH